MKITIPEIFEYYWMKFQCSVLRDFLKGANNLLGEGVTSWDDLNFQWESEFGTMDGMRRNLESFKEFVRGRMKKATS